MTNGAIEKSVRESKISFNGTEWETNGQGIYLQSLVF